MARPRSLWRSVAEGLLTEVSTGAVSPVRRTAVGTRVGEVVGHEPRAAPAPAVIVEERSTSRLTVPRALVWCVVTALGWVALTGRTGLAALAELESVPAVTRCAGVRELDLALAQARSMGLAQAAIRIRASALFAPHPGSVKIEVLATAPEAPAAPGAVLSLRFPAGAPPVRFELAMPPEALPDVVDGRAAAPEPVALLRQRAYARGLTVNLERLSGGQLQPLASEGGRTLWEYGLRCTGNGPTGGLRQLLADLDGGDWLVHVEDLEVLVDGPRARFTLEGTLVAGGTPAPGGAATLAPGERRVIAVEPTDALAVLPAGAAELQRVGGRLALVTARRSGSARVAVRGETARELAFTVTAADPAAPALAPAAAPRGAGRPPPFPRLLGTSVAEAGARALFAEKDAREGDVVGPFRVDQVTEEGVRLSYQGRRFFVPLSGTAREEVELEGEGNQDIGSSKAQIR